MANVTDYFEWCQKLECPPIACNETTKRILSKGLVGLLWEDIAKATFPMQHVETIRKNILLYKLKHAIPDKNIEAIKKLSRLNNNESVLQKQIEDLENEHTQQDFVVRRQLQQLKEIKSSRSQLIAKKRLIQMKESQTSTQLADCTDMRLVCQHLKPGTHKDIDPNVVKHILSVVSNLCSGASKKEIWDKISEVFGEVDIPKLWHHLYQMLQESVDSLMKLEVEQNSDPKLADGINIAITQACGQHVHMVAKSIFYNKMASKHQQEVVGVLQQIEESTASNSDISEWVVLALEVRKLQVELKRLQTEVEEIQADANTNNTLFYDLAELKSTIGSIDLEMEQSRQNIHESLALLKSSPMLINKIKEKLYFELQKIAAMRNNSYDKTWLQHCLTTEMDTFYESLELNALRKIMLKGDIGAYRYSNFCLGEVSLTITPAQGSYLVPYFPMVQMPIYYLIQCYKHLATNITYQNSETLPASEIVNASFGKTDGMEYTLRELLNLSKVVCEKTNAEINEFNKIFDAWTKQTVQTAMDIIDDKVEGASFPEWLQRFECLIYLLQNHRTCENK